MDILDARRSNLENNFPWSPKDWSDKELEDLAVFENLVFIYGLGYASSGKKFSIVHGGWFVTEYMSLSEVLVFLRNFEEKYRDEVWFRPGFYARNKAIVKGRFQGGTGESGPKMGSMDGPDN